MQIVTDVQHIVVAVEHHLYDLSMAQNKLDKLKPLKYEKRDKIAYIVLFVFLAVMIYLSFFSPWR